MLNLTPIPKRIQQRLFEKMRVLGRTTKKDPPNISNSKSIEYGLTHAKLNTRSTFLRMVSGIQNPVILMGGKLQEFADVGEGGIPGGYNDIYGQRTYIKTDIDVVETITLPEMATPAGYSPAGTSPIYGHVPREDQFTNPRKRPMPGIKSIDAQFKGGVRALREATISWSCWDWEELNYLMPHFLAHGKTVMVQWGWVYDKNSLMKVPSFIDYDMAGNRFIAADAYTDYKNEIIDKDGDFDMMVGIIKNFEFTTREDGGFDCQTILTSVGASIVENIEPNQEINDPGIIYNLSLTDRPSEVSSKLDDALAPSKSADAVGTTTETNDLIDLNTNLTLKVFIKEINEYIQQELASSKNSKGENVVYKGMLNHEIRLVPNKFLAIQRKKKIGTSALIKEAWVRWGWFEDNILSKFLSITSTDSDNPIITEFRSIERNKTVDGKDSGKYESIRIKNHSELETTNIKHYILPGQFKPQGPTKVIIHEGTENEKEVLLPGDETWIQNLAELVNERWEPLKGKGNSRGNFKSFATETDTIKTEVGTGEYETREEDIVEKHVDFTTLETVDVVVGTKTTNEELTKEVETTAPKPGKYGYLRNMLIHTDLIKQMFGVSGDGEFTVESVSTFEAMETLFTLLNQSLNFWNLQLVVDEEVYHRVKIIDDQVTNFDFQREGGTVSQQSISTELGDVIQVDGTRKEGVFFFPTWRADSLVKRQNVTAKIPNSMQLSIMYGANMDQMKDFMNPGSQFSDKRGVIAGGFWNNSSLPDKSKQSIDIAFRNKHSRKIGNSDSSANSPLKLNNGDDIEKFIRDNSEKLKEAYESKLKEIDEALKTSAEARELEQSGNYDTSVPPPMIDSLSSTELGELLEEEEDDESFLSKKLTGRKLSIGKLYSSKFFQTGEMKPPFVRSVSYLTTQHGIYKTANDPISVPFELELDIDGIGGIYPGNSFHSEYLPSKYKDKAVFQAFDINHRLDSSGWTVTLSGKMRSTMDNVFEGYRTLEGLKKDQLENYMKKAKRDEKTRSSIKDWKLRREQALLGASGYERQQARIAFESKNPKPGG